MLWNPLLLLARDKQDCQERVAGVRLKKKKKKEAEVILIQVYKNYTNTIQLLVSWCMITK